MKRTLTRLSAAAAGAAASSAGLLLGLALLPSTPVDAGRPLGQQEICNRCSDPNAMDDCAGVTCQPLPAPPGTCPGCHDVKVHGVDKCSC